MDNSKIIAEIEERMAKVSEERDKLDKLLEEVTYLRDNCDEAYNCLHDARDALSELV